MNLTCGTLLFFLLIQVSICIRNFHFPHQYFHGQEKHNYYPNYEDSSSESMVLRSQRNRYHRYNSDYSDLENNYKWECRCSCAKCRKPKPKPCCMDFCMQCPMQNNILLVPYPVPFVIPNQSAPHATATKQASTHSSSSSLPQQSTPTQPPTPPETHKSTTSTTSTSTTTTQSNDVKLKETRSTAAFMVENPHQNRFQVIRDWRRRSMGNKDMRPPPKFDQLPKYGIVPIPEKLAIRLMEQMRDKYRKNQYRRQANVDRNVMQNY